MATLLISVAKVLVTEISNQANYSSSFIEIAKILVLSSVWVGGLILWVYSSEKKMKMQQNTVVSN